MEEQKLIDQWLHGRPATTQAAYALAIRRFQAHIGKSLALVTLEDIQSWHQSMAHLKASSQQSRLGALKSLLSFAVQVQAIDHNPAAAMRLKSGRKSLAGRFLKKEQVKALLSVQDVQDKALLALLYGTGARASEVCSLTWADFQESDRGAVQCRFKGKGDKERVVILPEQVWALVRELRCDRPTSDPVFWQGVEPMNRHGVWAAVKAAARRIGLPKVSPHWLRHSHAIHSLEGGAPLQLVRDTLGHSSIAVTNVYLESNPEDSSSRYLDF